MNCFHKSDTNISSYTILGKSFGIKYRNRAKSGGTRKFWYLLLRPFSLLFAKFYFWRETWYWATSPSKFEIFPKFRNNLSRKSFGNSWGNSFTKIFMQDKKFDDSSFWKNSLFWLKKKVLRKNTNNQCWKFSKVNFWSKTNVRINPFKTEDIVKLGFWDSSNSTNFKH